MKESQESEFGKLLDQTGRAQARLVRGIYQSLSDFLLEIHPAVLGSLLQTAQVNGILRHESKHASIHNMTNFVV